MTSLTMSYGSASVLIAIPPAFAVNAIGKKRYPKASQLMISVDGGGNNG